MKLLCRISLTPDTCVNDTQSSFERWGAKVLIVAKFIPGLSLVAPPLAGATRMGAGASSPTAPSAALLWVGAALLGGVLLRPQIEQLLPHVAALGGAAIAVILVLLLALHRLQVVAALALLPGADVARISVDELYRTCRPARAAGGARRALGDRPGLEQRRIPGALHVPVAAGGRARSASCRATATSSSTAPARTRPRPRRPRGCS